MRPHTTQPQISPNPSFPKRGTRSSRQEQGVSLADQGIRRDPVEWRAFFDGMSAKNPRLKGVKTFTLHVSSDEYEQLGEEFNKVFKVQ